MNEQLNNYIEQSLKLNKTDKDITENLLSAGWKEEQINESFAFVKEKQKLIEVKPIIENKPEVKPAIEEIAAKPIIEKESSGDFFVTQRIKNEPAVNFESVSKKNKINTIAIIGLSILLLSIIGGVSYFLFTRNKSVVNSSENKNQAQSVSQKTNNESLVKAVEDGDLKKIQELIKAGADIDVRRDKDGATMLMIATGNQNMEILKELILAGADVNAKYYDERTVLDIALRLKYDDIANELKKAGAKNGIGEKNLEDFVKAKDIKKVQELIRAGVNVNSKNPYDGTTVLMYAAQSDSLDIVMELIKAGADVNAKDDIYGMTSLMSVRNINITKELIKAGADVNAKSFYGRTVLDYISATKNIEIINELKKAGAKETKINKDLINAIENKDIKKVQELIKSGADVNERGLYGETALMYASQYDSLEITKELIKAGADVNASGVSGGTILISAVSGGNPEIVKELVRAGANVDAKTLDEETALMYACLLQDFDVVKVLIDAGADVNAKSLNATPLINASLGINLNIIQALIKAGADVNATDWHKGTALMVAAYNSTADVVKALIDAGADVNAIESISGDTALIEAAFGENLDIMQELIKAGADINVIDKNGTSAMTRALEKNNSAIVNYLTGLGFKNSKKDNNILLINSANNNDLEKVKELIKAGADVNATDWNKETALMWSSRRGYTKIVAELLKAGADVNLKDNGGSTALMEATAQKHIDIVQLLKYAGAKE
jgi:ankyrin repeat protein